jgi:hypothetical protein
MARSLDYLNATMRYGRFYLVEIVRLEGNDLVAHSAQVVAKPSNRNGGTITGNSKANEADFLERIADDNYREALRDILARATTLGLLIAWGSKGASLRLKTPDRNEPVSVAWTFLDRDQWYGADERACSGVPASSSRPRLR